VAPVEPAVKRTHEEIEARVEEGGGRARADRHRRLGRRMPRERIALLVDPQSFVELGRYVLHDRRDNDLLAANRHPSDGVVCGLATIDGRAVAVIAHDPTALRGSVGGAGGKKICRLLSLARERRLPVITLADSDGARVPEGMDAVFAGGEVMQKVVELRGVAPQITVACGLCVGMAAYSAALTDVVCMVRDQSFLFVTGPKVTKAATGEDVPIDELGGWKVHAKLTGQCHVAVDTEEEGIAFARRLLSFLPGDGPSLPGEGAPGAALPAAAAASLAEIVPEEQRKAYDARKVAAALFDEGSVLELHRDFAPSLLAMHARLEGTSVAVLASQPMHLGGILEAQSSRKGAAHIRRAIAWGLPLITLVDVPGYKPGKKEEQEGILPFGAELIAAYGEAKGRVPLLCLILRKSYGGGSVLSFAADVRLALPFARVAPMGVEAALDVEHGALAEDASAEARAARDEARAQWLAENDAVWPAAEKGYIDLVVPPAGARAALASSLAVLCKARGDRT
jgi:acetyl-CoA carboxylase carboxyltransferase component